MAARTARQRRDVDGILLLDKPLGMTSNQALQRVKHLFQARKAGHTGALDPLASGLLPICLGEATKFSQLLLESEKQYQTTARFGEVRSTGDAEGEVLSQYAIPELTVESVESVLRRFRGEIEQVPPLFSALKLNGRPLYELARAGLSPEEAQAVAEQKRRRVRILSLECLRIGADSIDLEVRCSKGTYIRTLVEDLAAAMNSGAYVSRLHRTATGPYSASGMIRLEALEALSESGGTAALDQQLLPPESAIPDWPVVELNAEEAERIRHGQRLPTGLADAHSVQLRAVCDTGQQLIGIGNINAGVIKPVRLLNLARAD